MQKPKAKILNEDGNIYNLLSIAKQALVDAEQPDKADEMIKRVTSSSSYTIALSIIMEYVEVI